MLSVVTFVKSKTGTTSIMEKEMLVQLKLKNEPENFVKFRIEFLNIVSSKTNSEQVGLFLDRMIGSSDPEVLVDQESDLSSTILGWGLMFFQTDSSFELRIVDDSVRC